ncbi:hypothetical protein CWI39_1420p0010 [Hamiltosporidium magnivora]|uniref:ATPase AAA-type core domain-containing protein n=1 Tax=Hamiltosporidium magnivora TaxID=148818 RepID=A0A4Q9L1Q5_9MICR|nr:hypothetical protein CWI39_1420p0010 [Hamiltosporidium magnivora]
MLWSYKYKPIYFKDLYFKDNLHLQCATWLSQWTRNSSFLILSGPSGIGKTSLAYILANTYDFNIIEIDNTTIKDILIISKGISLNNKKHILIIDDIHITSTSNTPHIINILNFLIKNKSKIHCPVILITNDLYSIPFKFSNNYFLTVNFKIPGKREVEGVINKCIEDNNITIDYRAFQFLIENNTDIRSVINTLQLLSSKDKDYKNYNDRSIIGGDNNSNSNHKGVSNCDDKQQGVGNSTSNHKGVSDCDNKQQGVGDCDDKQQGVSNNTNEQRGVGNCNNKQQGVSNSTNEQRGVNNNTDKQHPVNKPTDKQHPVNTSIIISLTDVEKYCKITQGNIYKIVENIFRKKLEGFKELNNIYKGFGDRLSVGCFNTYLSKYINTEETNKENSNNNNRSNINNTIIDNTIGSRRNINNNIIDNSIGSRNNININTIKDNSLPKKDGNLLNKIIKISDFNFYYERFPEEYNYMLFGTYNTLFRGSMSVRVDLSVKSKCVHKRKVGHDYFYYEIDPYLNLIIKNENLDFEYLKEISRKFNLKDLNILEKRCYEIKAKQRVFKYKYKEGVSMAVKIVINKRELNGI